MSNSLSHAEGLRVAQEGVPAFGLCVLLLLTSVFLQKVAIPGFNGALPFAAALLPIISVLGLLGGRLVIVQEAFVSYVIFIAFAFISAVASPSPDVSFGSFSLLVVLQFCLTLRSTSVSPFVERTGNFFLVLCCIISALAVFQLIAQYAVDRELAFFFDINLPEFIKIKGYNIMNPLFWSSPILKSNGIFLAEPSYLSQFLAIGLSFELTRKSRPVVMLLLSAGIFVSYSGTGIVMFGFFLAYYTAYSGRLSYVFAAPILLFLLIAVGDLINLDAITRRIDEFSNPKSSAFARYLSMFPMLREVFSEMQTVLLGRGPGTVYEFEKAFGYEFFGPTWGKIVYEYGAIGTMAYASLFYASVIRSHTGLRFPVAFTYLISGGYFLDGNILALICALVVWPSPARLNDTSETHSDPPATVSSPPADERV